MGKISLDALDSIIRDAISVGVGSTKKETIEGAAKKVKEVATKLVEKRNEAIDNAFVDTDEILDDFDGTDEQKEVLRGLINKTFATKAVASAVHEVVDTVKNLVEKDDEE